MLRLSSSSLTAFHKKVFPALWFGGLLLFLVGVTASGAYMDDPFFLIAPLVLLGFGFFLCRRLVWNLADEVYDGGDHLLVRKRDEEERVAIGDIMNVSVTTPSNPPWITLRLSAPGRFGREISFIVNTPFTLNPFTKNAVAEDLIERVYRARPSGARITG